jgi:hypothetical protein
MGETTLAIWITHNPTTVSAIRAMLRQLEAADALEFTQVRISSRWKTMVAASVPGRWRTQALWRRDPSVSKGETISWRELPAEGMLHVTRAPSDS